MSNIYRSSTIAFMSAGLRTHAELRAVLLSEYTVFKDALPGAPHLEANSKGLPQANPRMERCVAHYS